MANIQQVGLREAQTRIGSKEHYAVVTVLKNRQGGTGVSEKRVLANDMAGPRPGASDRREITSRSGLRQAQVIRPASLIGPTSTSIAGVYALPLPQQLTYTTSQEWADDDTSALEQLIGYGAKGGGANGIFSGDALSYLAGLGINIAVGKASQSSFRKALADKGLAYNPFKELFYNGVAFRRFTYTWQFAPISAAEAQALNQLIYDFEFHSAPDVRYGPQSPFILPDSFEIEWANTKLPKLKSLVLTSVGVDYANSGAGPKFNTDDHPSFVALTLEFLETALITRAEVTALRTV